MGLDFPSRKQLWTRLYNSLGTTKRRDRNSWNRVAHTHQLHHEPLEERRLLAAWVPQGPSPALNGQTENISPNNQVTGAIHTVVAHPANADTLWVGAVNGGVWRTDNATSASPTWTPLTDDQNSLSIGALELDPTDATNNTLIAGMGRFSSFSRQGGALEGILITTDGGTTWINPGSTGLIGQNVSGIAARGLDIVVAGNGNNGSGGLFRSTDGGATFASITNGLPGSSPDIFDLVVDPTNSLRLYATVEDSGIYRSDDFGLSWNDISSGDPTLDAIISSSSNNNTEMAVANNGRLFVMVMLNGQANYIGYTDDPTAITPTWTAMDLPQTPESNGETEGLNPREKPGGQGSIHSSIRVDPANPNTIYVGGDRQDGPFTNFLGATNFTGRLFRGDTTVAATGAIPSPQWEHLTHSDSIAAIPGGGTASGSAPHADSREIVFDAAGDLIEVDDGGIYRRTNPQDNTGDWFSIIGNLAVTEQHDVAYDSLSNIIISGNQDTGTTQQQFEGSAIWDSVSTADGGDVAVDDSGLTSFRYSSFQNLGSFRRREYDANNNLIAQVFLAGIPDAQFVTPVELNAVDPTRLAIGGTGSVYESFDRGLSNNAITGSTGANRDAIAFGHVSDPDLLVVGSGSSILVRDSFVGNAMTATTTPFPGGSVRDIVLDPTVADAYYVVAAGGLYETLDGGTVWTNITGNLFSLANEFRSIEFVEAFPDDGLVVGTDTGVYFADSSEFTFWSELGTDLPNVIAYDLDYDPNDDLLVVGTLGRGAWTLSDTSVEINGVDLPEFAAKNFKRLEPFGSLVSVSTKNTGTISFVGDTDDFTFLAEAGETLTAIVRPLTGTSTLTAEFVGLGAAVGAGAPGETVVLPPVQVLADGIARIRISGNLDAGYEIEIYRNATLEALVVDSGPGNALSIDDAFLTSDGSIPPDTGRAAVVGTATVADTDRYTFDFSPAVGSSIDIVLAGLSGVDFSFEQLDLISPDGTTIVQSATANPLGPNAENYDLAILGFTLSEVGPYTLEFSSAIAGDYTIVVTKSLAFDSEPNATADPLPALDAVDGAQGFLDVSNPPGGLDFVIDSGLTSITIGGAITIPNSAFSVPLVPQLPGSDTTSLSGTVRGSFGPNSFQFLGGSVVDAMEQPGPFLPGNGPADVALQVEISPALIGSIAVRDAFFDVASGPIPVDANGNFDGEGITISITGGTGSVEVPGLIQGDFDLTGGFAVNMTAITATIETIGESRRITVPIETTIELAIPDTPFFAEVTIVGLIVATVVLDQDIEDNYEVDLVTGQQIIVSTDTPLDTGTTPLNSLDPELYLFAPSGVQVAFDLNSAPDGKNAQLSFVATETGTYRVEVRADSGIGEYLLSVNVAPTAGIAGPASGVPFQPRTFTLTAADNSPSDQAAGFTFGIDWDGDDIVDETVVGPSGIQVTHAYESVNAFTIKVTATDQGSATSSVSTHPINIVQVELQGADLVWGGTTGNDSVEFEETAAQTVEVRTTLLNGIVVSDTQIFVGVSGQVIAYGGNDDDIIDAGGVDGLTAISASLVGGRGNDTIDGGDAADTLRGDAEGDGSEGRDIIGGGGGNDLIYGDGVEGSDDTISGGDGNDTIYGDNDDLTTDGAEGYDVINGDDGDDSLFGGGKNDTIFGGNGNDFVDGGFGNDVIIDADGAGGGNDTLIGGAGHDILSGGTGNDSLDGGTGKDILFAGVGADTLRGNNDDDLLVAGPTSFDFIEADLKAINAEWRSSNDYATRVSNISGIAGGANDPVFLQPGVTAFDDSDVDVLFGEGGVDWFLYNMTGGVVLDILSDLEGGEVESDLTP